MNLLRTTLATLAATAVMAGCDSGGSSGDHAADPPVRATSTAATSPSATPTQAPPPPPAPNRGDCYSLRYDQAVAPTSDKAAVGCARGHTSQTYSVGQLDELVHGHLYAVDSDRVQQQVAQACPTKLAHFLGATQEQLELSVLRPVWFTPTVEESDAGASWFRCDVIAVAGDNQLAKLTGGLRGALNTDAGRTEYGMCGTDQPGTADFARVLCRDDHSWRAIKVLDLTGLPTQSTANKGAANKGAANKGAANQKGSGQGSYPGLDAVKAAGADPCAAAARAIAPDALDYQWGYEWPTKKQWDAGQTYGRCWAPD